MKTKTKKNRVKQWPYLLMLLPGLIYIIVNNYLPMAGIMIAFKDIDFSKGIMKSDWVGLDNFKFLFKTKDALIIIRNTLGYNLIFIFLGTIFSVAVAILLNELVSRHAKKAYQTIILLPQLISIVIIAYVVYAFLNSENGLLNHLLEAMGKDGISWYTEKKYWPFLLTFIYIWKSIGYSSIIYYAAIMGIDASMYEAARVDGASRLRQIFSITIPLLKPTIITLVLLSIGRIFYSDFGLFYQVPMNSGALYSATSTIDTYVYRALLQLNDLSMSSAASVFQSLVGFIFILVVNYIVRKVDSDNALF